MSTKSATGTCHGLSARAIAPNSIGAAEADSPFRCIVPTVLSSHTCCKALTPECPAKRFTKSCISIIYTHIGQTEPSPHLPHDNTNAKIRISREENKINLFIFYPEAPCIFTIIVKIRINEREISSFLYKPSAKAGLEYFSKRVQFMPTPPGRFCIHLQEHAKGGWQVFL